MTKTQFEKSVVVLAAAPGRLKETERFLAHRGWTIRIHSDMKTFLSEVSTLKPRYALISIDYDHPGIEKIRPLLKTVYKTVLIEFAEQAGIASWTRLKEIESENKLFGPLTGPSFERMIHGQIEEQEIVRTPGEIKNTLRDEVPSLMKRIFGDSSVPPRCRLVWASHVTCVQIRTLQLSGHFIVATASDKPIEDGLKSALRDALLALFQRMNVPVEGADTFPIEIRKVEFSEWARSSASFIEKTVQDGVEIAMAFFPVDKNIFRLEETSLPEMASIEIDEIQPEIKLDFELFLHLPLNGKIILYVSRGGWMSFQQQMTLQSHGVRRMFVRRSDANSVFRNRAARRIDRSIMNFYENKAIVA